MSYELQYSKYANVGESLNIAYPVVRETVPMTSLGYKTNNKYPEFPPLMSDGRSVTTTWQSESVVNEDLKARNHITSNWEYRKYLTQNAKSVMETNFQEASNDIGYSKRHADLPSIQSNAFIGPAISPSATESRQEPSDLKQLYLSREDLASRNVSQSVLTQAERLRAP